MSAPPPEPLRTLRVIVVGSDPRIEGKLADALAKLARWAPSRATACSRFGAWAKVCSQTGARFASSTESWNPSSRLCRLLSVRFQTTIRARSCSAPRSTSQ